jgi:hypothetical protein
VDKATFSASVAWLIPGLQKGRITSREVAAQLLHVLTFPKRSSEPLPRRELDADFVSAVGTLPEAVKHDFIALLERVRDRGFSWTPFMIGGRLPPADPDRLRQNCEVLGLTAPND